MSQPNVSPLFKVEAAEPEPHEVQAQAKAQKEQAAAIAMIQIALVALSQRALTALASLFTLMTVGSAFVLWLLIPDPNVHQLVGLGMYAIMVLAINIVVRKLK